MDDEWKCNYCHWPADFAYVLARTEDEARQLLEDGDAGLCGECIGDLISEEGYIIIKINDGDDISTIAKELLQFAVESRE